MADGAERGWRNRPVRGRGGPGAGIGRSAGHAGGRGGCAEAGLHRGAPARPGAAACLPQPAFPAGLWRPGATGTGTWRPDRAPVASLRPAGAPAAAGRQWRVQQTPDPVIPNGAVDAVSGGSPGTCIAVGGYENQAGAEVPLAQARTSAGWRILAAATPPGAVFTTLLGVSCTATDACAAVGYYTDGVRHIHPLAEIWTGTRWKIQPVPSPPGHPLSWFFAVSCASVRACTAVGAQTDAHGNSTSLAERWNGAAWSIQATASPPASTGSELLAVSCASVTACTAGGADTDGAGTSVPLAERWNGTSWRIQATPAPPGSISAGFAGVSCSSATDCTAAGSYSAKSGSSVMLGERWNGASWRIQATPSPAGATGSHFLAVSCTAPGACTAVGAVTAGARGARTVGLAERWNGTTWRVQSIPGPGRSIGAGFAGVSCSSVTACTAAGSDVTASQFGRPAAASWRGKGWRRQAVPARAGASAANGLVGVSCASARACIAVGFSTATTGESTTLAERWDGGNWRIQPSPVPAGAVSAGLSGVSCRSPRACTAVGEFFSSGQRKLALAERWDGARWRVQPVPSPAAARQGTELSAVSCPSAHRCFAVGQYSTKSGPVALAETWNGARWAIQSLPGAVSNTFLLGVSCATPRACVAVGSYGTELWNGTGWRFVPMATPAGGQVISLDGVSCTSARACTAVGAYFSQNTGPLNLAEAWNGAAWRVQATPDPIPQGRNQLNSVSCTSPRSCTAVGVDAGGDFAPPGGFAETWDGARWRLQAIPVPPGTVLAELFTASCPVPATCTAAGTIGGQSMITVTLALRTG